MKIKSILLSSAIAGSMLASGIAMAKPVGITPKTSSITYTTASGSKGTLTRNQNNSATIHKAFAKTSRPCPPFCIQPTHPFKPANVETVSELDMINAVRDIGSGDKTQMIIDARTPVWATANKGGKIPLAVNIPFSKISGEAVTADPDSVIEILTKHFGVESNDDVLNFKNAKTLYLYCNGLWCGQSPRAIRALLSLGYPEHKLKYYRGGMNAWHSLGLSTTSN